MMIVKGDDVDAGMILLIVLMTTISMMINSQSNKKW